MESLIRTELAKLELLPEVPAISFKEWSHRSKEEGFRDCEKTDGERTVTYKELLKKLRCCAALFQAHNVGPGDKVYCHFENSIEAFVALYSVGVAGATVVLSDPEYKEGTAYFAVDDVPGFVPICNYATYNEEDYRGVTRNPDRVLVMAYTSGTTGQSKSVEITEERFLRKVCGMEVTGIYTANDVCLACEYLTIYLSFSFNFKFICCGARLVISDRYWSVHEFISTATSQKVSLLMTTPSVLYLLASSVAVTGTKLPSLSKVVSLGATLPKSTAGLVLSTLKPKEFRNVYGLSEASGVVCCPPVGETCYDNVGFPVADTQVKITDPQSGKALPALQRGEIMVRSPNIMIGYYNHGQPTGAAVDDDGWLRTGDVGYYDHSGRLFVTERLKSVIKCLDTKVEPFEVEQCILESRHVSEVAVLGVPHAVLGEAPAAIVVPRQALKEDEKRHIAQLIKDHVAGRLAVYKGLHGGIVFADQLPKNKRGKVLKRHLMAEFVKLKKMGIFY
ncbi:hypothetical protein HPB50_009258 [Hyalomma asiaticum]|uniref:Uncharacterized protein n=1 Tax=Hyalomma asiaticum TaxID=266040 RepID=A0ACB7T5D3_HYAAI|nr:hypothetical protein HPB50_009258 [Hyalomma asiaticum]